MRRIKVDKLYSIEKFYAQLACGHKIKITIQCFNRMLSGKRARTLWCDKCVEK